MAGGKKVHSSHKHVTKTKGHPGVWAFLTVLTFPIVLVATDIMGFPGLLPFVYAALATLGILMLEALVRGRLWPFEPEFEKVIGEPELPLRLLIFLAALVLVLESFVIFVAIINRGFDTVLLQLITTKECAAAYDTNAVSLCEHLTGSSSINLPKTKTLDPAGFAVRQASGKQWFPAATLVTCASRAVFSDLGGTSGIRREIDLVSCTDWRLDGAVFHANSSTIRFTATRLSLGDDGFFRVDAWSDDPTNQNWTSAMGDLATTTREKVNSIADVTSLQVILEAEALGKAQQELQ
jgi:hypothetical protein